MHCTCVGSVLGVIGGRRSQAEHQWSLVMIFQSVCVGHAVVHREIRGECDSSFAPALIRLSRLIVSLCELRSTLRIRCWSLEESWTERRISPGLRRSLGVFRARGRSGQNEGRLSMRSLTGAGAVGAVLLLGRRVTRLIWAVTVRWWVSLLPPGTRKEFKTRCSEQTNRLRFIFLHYLKKHACFSSFKFN